jgi:hypothetical protein
MLFRYCRNVLGLALLLCGVAAAADYPEPSPYPISWELQFTHGLPKRIVVDIPTKVVAPQAFWYMTYQVTNNTDTEQMFLPRFELLGENGKLYVANQNISKRVFDQIKDAEHNSMLEPITSITGQIRIGPAEARDGVAIWPEPMLRMGHFSIFVSGLSGEAVFLKKTDGKFQKVDSADDLKDTKNLIILRKTLQLNYFIRGDEVYPGEDEVNVDSELWIMR